MKKVNKLSLDFVVYGVRWISPTHLVVGGGGGQGIPNRLVICQIDGNEIKIVSELDMKDDVVWGISVSISKKLIAIASIRKFFLASYDEKFKLTLGTNVDLYTDETNLGKVNSMFECILRNNRNSLAFLMMAPL